MTRLILAALMVFAPFPAGAVTIDDVVAEAGDFCASFDGGTVTVSPDAVQEVDLTGDGVPETVIDFAGIACSTVASAWGGTGGTTLTVLIDGKRFDHMALEWKVADFGGPVLLLSQHGVTCGLTGVDRCVQALVWSAGTLTGPGADAVGPADEPAADGDGNQEPANTP